MAAASVGASAPLLWRAIAAAAFLGACAAPADAYGAAAQRKACTSDAGRLCKGTHKRLSSRQRQARRRVAGPPSNDHMPGPRFLMPGDRETAADARRARSVVRRLCRTNVLDAGTCALTNGAIDLAR